MNDAIKGIFVQSAETQMRAGETIVGDVAAAAEILIEAYSAGRKSIIFGNGGSAADAQHYAAELTGRFVSERRALPAIALTVDTSALTSIGNDYGLRRLQTRAM
jgi:D-sedoheptulose 7-phosphate isomerase